MVLSEDKLHRISAVRDVFIPIVDRDRPRIIQSWKKINKGHVFSGYVEGNLIHCIGQPWLKIVGADGGKNFEVFCGPAYYHSPLEIEDL